MKITRNYLLEMESDRKSPETLRTSINTLQMFYRWKTDTNKMLEEFSDEDILNVTSNDLRNYKIYMSRVYKPTGANTKLRYLSMFWNWLRKRGYTDINIFENVEEFNEPKRSPISMEISEASKLLGYVGKLKTIHGTRDYVILMTLLSSGVRISEVLSLKPSMITRYEVEEGFVYGLTVIGKGDKERDTILTEGAYNALMSYINKHNIADDELIFKVKVRTVEKNLKTYLEKTGLDTKYTPHKLRHTFATMLYENDVQIEEISKYLGHQSTSTTTNYYVKISDRQKRKASSVHPMNLF